MAPEVVTEEVEVLVCETVALALASLKVIAQVMTSLGSLIGDGTTPTTPTVPIVSVVQHSKVQHIEIVAPRLDEISKVCVFSRMVTRLVMPREEYYLFYRFTKMKPPIFNNCESHDAYEFIIDCHKRLNKMGVVEKHGVEFVTF